MEQLTPELERRLQVEELWARRNVLNDSMNARRCERFRTRHQMLSRLGTQALPLPAHMPPPDAATDSVAPVVLTMPARPMRPIPVPDSPGGARRAWGVAGLAAAAMLLLAIGFQNNDMIAGARAQWQAAVPRLMQMIAHPGLASAPATPPPATVGRASPPDLRAEVSAEIAAAMARRR